MSEVSKNMTVTDRMNTETHEVSGSCWLHTFPACTITAVKVCDPATAGLQRGSCLNVTAVLSRISTAIQQQVQVGTDY